MLKFRDLKNTWNRKSDQCQKAKSVTKTQGQIKRKQELKIEENKNEKKKF